MLFPTFHHVSKKANEKIVKIVLSTTPELKWLVKHRDESLTFFYEFKHAIKDWFFGIFRKHEKEEEFLDQQI